MRLKAQGFTAMLLSPLYLAVLLMIPGLVSLFFGIHYVADQLRTRSADLEVVFRLAGLPLVQGYGHGIHIAFGFDWGLLILLIGPLVLGQLLALLEILILFRQSDI